MEADAPVLRVQALRYQMASKVGGDGMMHSVIGWDELPVVLTLEQVAAALQTGRTATYEAYRSGLLPGFKVGRKLRFSREVVRRFVEGRERQESAS